MLFRLIQAQMEHKTIHVACLYHLHTAAMIHSNLFFIEMISFFLRLRSRARNGRKGEKEQKKVKQIINKFTNKRGASKEFR